MNTIFILLFLLSIFAIPIGVIKPSILEKFIQQKISRTRGGMIMSGISALLFVCIALTTEVSESTNITVKTSEMDQQAAQQPITPTPEPVIEVPQPQTFLVTRVIDGDTVELEDGTKIRYIGIDTPETVSPSVGVECFGGNASDKNKELVLNKQVSLEKDVSETDRYGRLLRYVYVDGVFINDYLVRNGYANASSYPPDIKFQEQFADAEKEARENNRGLWTDCKVTSTEQPLPVEQISSPEPTQTTSEKTTSTTDTENASNTGTSQFTCNCSKTCPNISSCEEAQYLLNTCGCSARDRDGDGIACDDKPLNCQN